jgi:hypothetical protein
MIGKKLITNNKTIFTGMFKKQFSTSAEDCVATEINRFKNIFHVSQTD